MKKKAILVSLLNCAAYGSDIKLKSGTSRLIPTQKELQDQLRRTIQQLDSTNQQKVYLAALETIIDPIFAKNISYSVLHAVNFTGEETHDVRAIKFQRLALKLQSDESLAKNLRQYLTALSYDHAQQNLSKQRESIPDSLKTDFYLSLAQYQRWALNQLSKVDLLDKDRSLRHASIELDPSEIEYKMQRLMLAAVQNIAASESSLEHVITPTEVIDAQDSLVRTLLPLLKHKPDSDLKTLLDPLDQLKFLPNPEQTEALVLQHLKKILLTIPKSAAQENRKKTLVDAGIAKRKAIAQGHYKRDDVLKILLKQPMRTLHQLVQNELISKEHASDIFDGPYGDLYAAQVLPSADYKQLHNKIQKEKQALVHLKEKLERLQTT